MDTGTTSRFPCKAFSALQILVRRKTPDNNQSKGVARAETAICVYLYTDIKYSD